MAITDRVREHLARVAGEHPDAGYITRAFRTAEDWEKWSTHEWRGHRFGNEPGLPALLEYRRIVVLGEPGSGKSTLASACGTRCRRQRLDAGACQAARVPR